MPELSPGVSDLDQRLAEIDRRLRQIQADLQPEREPPPSRPAVEVEPDLRSASDPAPAPEPLSVVADEPEPASAVADEPEPASAVADEPEPASAVADGPEPATAAEDEPEPEVPIAPTPEREPDPAPGPASEPQPPPERERDLIPEPEREPPLPPEPEEHRGRSGPLAALLQRSRRSQPREQLESPAPTSEPSQRPADPLEHILALTQLHTKLLMAMQELLDGYQQVLTQLPRLPGPERPSPSQVTLSVGPFTSLEEVRAFEQALARLPDVREVSVRGYEGADRALLEVQLGHRTP